MRLFVVLSLLLAAGCDGASATAAAPPPKGTASAARTGATTATAVTTATGRASHATAPAADTCARVACLDIERCDPPSGTCAPACPAGEVYVPATGPGGFVMGKAYHGKTDRPHKVILTKPFCMDATEVTVKAYRECVEQNKCTAPRTWGMWINYPKLDDHPVNKIDWKQSKRYCEFRGQSLPSEAQWEWAATRGDGRTWAWGNEAPSCERTDYAPGVLLSPSSDDGCHGGGTSPVGSHPSGDTVWPAGRIHDLSGNVWEWCLDNYLDYPLGTETDPVHLKATDSTHILRGGGWNRSHTGIRAHYRGSAVVSYKVPGLGFRCVRNPK